MLSSLPATSLAVLSLPVLRSALAQSISISIPNKAPSDASDYLDPSFAGFGIEPSNLLSFTGHEETNNMSITLLQNLADYSGGPPFIRLGGNTQDYFIYDPEYERYGWSDNKESKAQGAIAADSMIIGPNYFKALDRFPADTPVTFGLNMAYMDDDWKDQITTLAQAAVDGMQNVKLYSFEIGNEPDLWLQNGFRSGSWGGPEYTEQFLDRAEVVYERVLEPAGLPSSFFEAPATASTIGTSFEIETLVNAGIMEGRNGDNYLSMWNQHDYFYFIGVTPTPITLDELMHLDGTNAQFTYWEKQVKIALKTGLPYVLREMSSIGPIGMAHVSDTFGASLWTLNFFLYAASIHISSVEMHMTDNSNASAWAPIPKYGHETSFVRPQYYAHAAMAQIIGNGNGTTQITSLKTSDVGADHDGRIRAYAAYANDIIQSVTLINSKMVNASSSDKGSFTFNLDMGSENANKDVYISYLTADGADSESGVVWNGMSYDDITGQSFVAESTVVKSKTNGDGKITIPVRDSQAVVANIGSRLGENVVLKPDPTQSKKPTSGASSAIGSVNGPIFIAAMVTMLAFVVGI